MAWNEVEAAEGRFDFTIVDEILRLARSSDQRLILIWFGAFKNATSVYAPRWVREDTERFPRAHLGPVAFPLPFSYPGSTSKPVLSVFSNALRKADRAAYVALMRYLAEHDEGYTCVMTQVENEVGLLGAGRDHSPEAERRWTAAIPPSVLQQLRDRPELLSANAALRLADAAGNRSWQDVFGADGSGDELFMTWGFATYVEDLAAAGKREHPLPAFTNAWLGPQPGQPVAGMYPSGGPVASMIGLWRALAPSLDLIAPDIYVSDVEPVLQQYSVNGNPLFVPEARFRAGDMAMAVGSYGAIGYHVFGLDDGLIDNQHAQLTIFLRGFEQEVIAAQGEGRIVGFALAPGDTEKTVEVAGLSLTVRDAFHQYSRMLFDVGVSIDPPAALPTQTIEAARGAHPADERPFGVVIVLDSNELVVIGQRFMIDVTRPGFLTEIDEAREVLPSSNGMRPSRYLNGDERLLLTGTNRITAVRLRLLHRPATEPVKE
ncbi:DUF5597 domain-containing protein [Mycetocola zhujimingii]|uniref:DUF5597 domain-containing protein n=1 Tax=Mycetocola zhujimingii TaxID=2079792 RepID=UPI0013C41862|nr:DUF5597 domain-containing protein [Mycetocola zhujimingii]